MVNPPPAASGLTPLTARPAAIANWLLAVALLVFAVCCITACEACRLTEK